MLTNCMTNSVTRSYSFTGINTRFCPLTGDVELRPRKTRTPGMATQKFTQAFRIVRFRYLVMGVYCMPLELEW
jgi:hypothetical protein